MSDSYVQLQVPLGPIKPPWAASSKNALWDSAREAFVAGDLEWDQSYGFLCRLFDTTWTPDFTAPYMTVGQVPPGTWLSDPVALQGVHHTPGGYCKALGVRFPAMLTSRQIGGVAIYVPNADMVWAAVDWIGSPPLMQDVYVVWPADYGGPFRV